MKKLIPFLVISVVLVSLLIYSQERSSAVIVSGFIESDEIRVGSRVGGRVAQVFVDEGQTVQQGMPLIELEPFDLKERKAEAEFALAQAAAAYEKLAAGYRPEEVAQAKARRDQASAEFDKLKNGPRRQEIATAEAELRLAQAELKLAEQDYQRAESLYAEKAINKSDLDAAATKVSVARAEVETRTEQLALLEEGTRKEDIARGQAQLEETEQQYQLVQNGYRAEEIREAKAHREAAVAALAAIDQQISELTITAPTAAVVEAIELRPGDLVSPNAPVVSLSDVSRLWVRAYVPENRLNIQIGQEVLIRIDSFPNRTFAGHISFVARRAEFTPGNVQTPEERSKQVFRIKVLLTEGLDVLRPGMSADVILAEGGEQP